MVLLETLLVILVVFTLFKYFGEYIAMILLVLILVPIIVYVIKGIGFVLFNFYKLFTLPIELITGIEVVFPVWLAIVFCILFLIPMISFARSSRQSIM